MIRWKDRERSFQADLRKASHEAENMRAKLTEAHAESSGMKGEITELRNTKAALTAELVGVREAHENLLQEHSLRVDDLARQKKQYRSLKDRRNEEISAAREKAVRDYRLSADCQERKIRYGGCFTKYGFYLARSYLESKRPGEQFPELVYTDEAEESEVPDWRRYNDPDPTSPKAYLNANLADNLDNLSGPWEPYAFASEEVEMVDALPATNDAVFPSSGQEEGEVPSVPSSSAPPSASTSSGRRKRT